MTVIHAKTALLPAGWANDVRIEIVDSRIAAVTAGASPEGQGVDCLLPAMVNLHSHAFQRAMAGMTEYRSAGQDSFWTWRTLMYRFLDRLTPEDVQKMVNLGWFQPEGGIDSNGGVYDPENGWSAFT